MSYNTDNLLERIERIQREWYLADKRGDEYTAAALWLKLEQLKRQLTELRLVNG